MGHLLPVRGGWPFCWVVIFKILIVFEGSFSEKEVLPRGSCYEKWYKEIFFCYISKEINVRYNINFSWSWNYSERLYLWDLVVNVDVLRHSSLNHSSPRTWGRNDCMTNPLGTLCGRLNRGLHNFWRFICLVCSDKSCKEYNCWSKSKYILIVLSLACKSIISSTSNGSKRSFVQWFVVTAVNNIKHRSFNTTVNIKHVLNFGWISS